MKKYKLAMIAACLCSITSAGYAETDSGNWLVRLRAIDVIPDASSSTINLIGGQVNSISSEVVPELDISYFFSKHFSSELILATTKNNVYANNTSSGQVNLGSVNLLPPTLTFLYHFMPEKKISPYAGAGLNYTIFYNANHGPTATTINYGSSFGPALQVGVDYALNQNWSLNVDVKKIFIQSVVNADIPSGTLNPTVKINPLVVGAGIGYRF